MQTFLHRITEKGEAALADLVGERVSALYSRSLEVDGRLVSAREFSLSIWRSSHRGYCLIESDWADTPAEAIDYHMLVVSAVDWPRRIRRLVEPNRQDSMFEPSLVNLVGWFDSPIAAVLLLESCVEGDSERVQYDCGIVLEREDGYRFALFPPDSIVGGLQFTDDLEVIDSLVQTSSTRRRFDSAEAKN